MFIEYNAGWNHGGSMQFEEEEKFFPLPAVEPRTIQPEA